MNEQFYYMIDSAGGIISFGFDAFFGNPLKGDEPFSGLDCVNYQWDESTQQWIYTAPIIETENTIEL